MRGSNPVNWSSRIALISIFATVLVGCASSNVSRTAASNADMGFHNADKMGSDFTNGDFPESYQNTSNATKGLVLGGATGALVGFTSSSVGIVPGMVTGAILAASYGAYIDSQSTLQDQLINRGATIIVLGDQILVAIPSDRLFVGMTDTIKPQAYPTLDLLTQYLNQYQKTLIKVSAYTDDIGDKAVNVALSKQQARKVEHYLSVNGTDARLLYAEGYGPANLVTKNTTDWGKSDNYRIEITLEKLDA